MLFIVGVIGLFVGIAWLNLRAARKLSEEAENLKVNGEADSPKVEKV